MASPSLDSQLNADKRFRSSFSFKNRPRMLKDFLKDDSFSCSSNDFRSVPRKNLCKSNVTNKRSPILLRSGSKAAATTFYALNKVIKAVKFFPYASVKSPLVLPRSISRKLSRRTKTRNENFSEVSVKVKDILRWRSFRDLEEEKATSLNFSSSSPIRTATTTTGSTSTTTSCSKRSSWCDSDFTAADSPLWGGENDKSWGEKGSKTRRKLEGELTYEEAEQLTPVSVLDSPFCEDEESIFPFHLNSAQRKCMFMQRLQQFETLTELENLEESQVDNLPSDFFKNYCQNFENTAKSWINGEYENCEALDMKEACVKDMERGLDWKEFKDEQEEMAMQLLSDLFDELLDDFVASKI
ncbi:uncharacterized protein LOC111391559 [Olea europaea var. sylvestris]|uniref:uncharacterized protein LOC111391559 n=1 Tax=Olea europaea var. sylvestris TaxID=158386 RepID=UPI000C1D561D|nr:uncharacterized protein LOC111391559 [Olea europaea var. sylvestris]